GFGREALLQEAGDVFPAAESVALQAVTTAIPSTELERSVQAIIKSALQMNAAGISRVLDEAFAGTSSENVISGIILPAAKEIGDRWVAGRCSVASEHLASGIF